MAWPTFAGGLLREAILAGGDEKRLQDDEKPSSRRADPYRVSDTTVHLIGNGVAALAANPDQLDSLIDDPSGRAPAAVEEILRFDAPVRFFLRRTDDGRSVVVLFGSANRDERAFPEPDRFLIDRHPSEHLAFVGHSPVPGRAARPTLEGASVFAHSPNVTP